MDWNNVRRPAQDTHVGPQLDLLLETSWRMKGPSGRVLECSIHRHPAGVEVRCGYGENDLLRSQVAPEIRTARDIAEQWLQAVLAKGGFTEIDGERA